MINVFFVLSLFFLAGCGGMKINQELYDQKMTKSFRCSKQECFQAVQQSMKDMDLPLDEVDEINGDIQSGKAEVFRAAEVYTSSFGGYGSATMHTEKARMRVHVDGDENSCLVKVVKLELWRNSMKINAINWGGLNRFVWKPFVDGIQERCQ